MANISSWKNIALAHTMQSQSQGWIWNESQEKELDFLQIHSGSITLFVISAGLSACMEDQNSFKENMANRVNQTIDTLYKIRLLNMFCCFFLFSVSMNILSLCSFPVHKLRLTWTLSIAACSINSSQIFFKLILYFLVIAQKQMLQYLFFFLF